MLNNLSQDATFKICLSLFGWKENILPKLHIVQWSVVKGALDSKSTLGWQGIKNLAGRGWGQRRRELAVLGPEF